MSTFRIRPNRGKEKGNSRKKLGEILLEQITRWNTKSKPHTTIGETQSNFWRFFLCADSGKIRITFQPLLKNDFVRPAKSDCLFGVFVFSGMLRGIGNHAVKLCLASEKIVICSLAE